jgi:hypothetical protein
VNYVHQMLVLRAIRAGTNIHLLEAWVLACVQYERTQHRTMLTPHSLASRDKQCHGFIGVSNWRTVQRQVSLIQHFIDSILDPHDRAAAVAAAAAAENDDPTFQTSKQVTSEVAGKQYAISVRQTNPTLATDPWPPSGCVTAAAAAAAAARHTLSRRAAAAAATAAAAAAATAAAAAAAVAGHARGG